LPAEAADRKLKYTEISLAADIEYLRQKTEGLKSYAAMGKYGQLADYQAVVVNEKLEYGSCGSTVKITAFNKRKNKFYKADRRKNLLK
jgi:hypothetical protein